MNAVEAFMAVPGRDLVAATTTCFVGLDPWLALDCLRRAGIRYVEIPALPARQSVAWQQTTFSPETLGTNGAAHLRDRIHDMGLTPITVGAYASILEPDDIEPLLRRIDFAATLEASFVIIDAAGTEPTSAADWRRVATLGRYLGDYAEARGIRLAFEIHEGLARSGQTSATLMAEIDHPWVGINYDTANAIFYNDHVEPVTDIEEIADRVIHVHLKDTSGGRGDWMFGTLGTGRVDLAGIIAVLRRRGFRGPFSLEVEGFEGEDLTRAERIARVVASLDHLRSLGIETTASTDPATASGGVGD
jgi:L-ribulose-5-phosphate 3-epimerase